MWVVNLLRMRKSIIFTKVVEIETAEARFNWEVAQQGTFFVQGMQSTLHCRLRNNESTKIVYCGEPERTLL